MRRLSGRFRIGVDARVGDRADVPVRTSNVRIRREGIHVKYSLPQIGSRKSQWLVPKAVTVRNNNGMQLALDRVMGKDQALNYCSAFLFTGPSKL